MLVVATTMRQQRQRRHRRYKKQSEEMFSIQFNSNMCPTTSMQYFNLVSFQNFLSILGLCSLYFHSFFCSQNECASEFIKEKSTDSLNFFSFYLHAWEKKYFYILLLTFLFLPSSKERTQFEIVTLICWIFMPFLWLNMHSEKNFHQ